MLIREDRKQNKGKEKARGGGLMIGVKDNIPFKVTKINIRGRKDDITEWQTIEIPTHDGNKIRLTNTYIPPIRSKRQEIQGERLNRAGSESPIQQESGSERPMESERFQSRRQITRSSRGESPRTYENRVDDDEEEDEIEEESLRDQEERIEQMYLESEGFDLSRWPHKEFDMMFGDFNAHSPLWDKTTEETDKRGRVMENWMALNNMTPANSGEPTHTNRKTGKETTPYITIVHSALLDKITWNTENDFGSDHRPILITYDDNMPKVNTVPKYKWRLEKADWGSFAKEVDRNIPSNYKRKHQQVGKEAEEGSEQTCWQEEGRNSKQMLDDGSNQGSDS